MVEGIREGERPGEDLATSTLAEIYAQQGLYERARAIYERIAQRNPDDTRIAARIEALSRAVQERPAPSHPQRAFPDEERVPATTPTEPSRSGQGSRTDEVFENWLAGR